MRSPDREQTAAAYGIAVFFLAVLHDILMYSHGFGTLPKKPLTEIAMLVFVLAQAISLFIMNNRVLSEAKAAEQKLAVENAALEDLNRMKTEFLGNVSHELKTPLTVVSGHAQLLGAQLVGKEMAAARDKSRIISSEADRLALMVGQVLDVTRIEENRLTVEKRPCHIDELIYNAVEMHFPILNKAGNRLEIHAALDLPVVACDPGRITQVLVNLIANALRHTEQGEVTIAAKERDGFMEVSVSDTGAGISPDELSHLFTRYRPGSGKTGTGLGLYICKYLVEEHGGNIRVESALGKGTAFTFSLPLS
jgi:signal transduction histidine kinase